MSNGKSGNTALRLAGGALLLLSLLGWSAWWTVCNVYEFAPRLPGWPLLAGWLLALGLLWFPRRPYWVCWLLAAANGGFLLGLHRDWVPAGVMASIWLASVVLLVGIAAVQRPQKQTAGDMPAV